ncbi:hypothetical protein GYB61_00755 [bacterium]|nr:hypothetical protein [bacterium]
MNALARPIARLLPRGAALLLVMTGLMQACSAQSTPDEHVQFVGVSTAASYVRDGMTVVDVRTDGEWADGHLQAAVHMPLSTLDTTLAATDLDRSQPVLLHCKVGGRASRASREFAEAGFSDIRVLKPGGYAELVGAGLPTETARE